MHDISKNIVLIKPIKINLMLLCTCNDSQIVHLVFRKRRLNGAIVRMKTSSPKSRDIECTAR